MMGKKLILVVCCVVLSGCATTQKSANLELQSRIEFLEEEIKEKNSEIESMQRELRQTRQKSAARSDYEAAPKRQSTQAASVKKSGSDDAQDIVRVSGVTAEQVQQALKKAGFYDGKIDGKIGPKTKEAIKAFQRSKDLKTDGIVGKGTWSKLKRNL